MKSKQPHNNALDQQSFCRSRHLLFFAVFHNGSNASAAPGSRVSTRSKSFCSARYVDNKNDENQMKKLKLIPYITVIFLMSCTNRILINPEKFELNQLKSGENIKIIKINGKIFEDKYSKQTEDSVECAHTKYSKNEIMRIEKKEISTRKTLGFITYGVAGVVIVIFIISKLMLIFPGSIA